MTKKRALPLNARQQRFVDEYLVDLNATQAAIRSGYSAKTAGVQGPRLLTNVRIAEAIARGRAKTSTKLEITRERVLKELARVAFADIGEAFTADGSLRPLHEMPEDTRRALASVETDELFDGRGDDRSKVGVSRKVRLADKLRGLELLGKHLGLLDGGGGTQAADDGVIRIRRRGPDGSSVEVDIGADADRPERLPADADAVGVSAGPDADPGAAGRPREREDPNRG